MKILMKGKVETVSVDRVKPAHFECASDTGTEVERKTQEKTTHSKMAGISHGTRKSQKDPAVKLLRSPFTVGQTAHIVIIVICKYDLARPGIIK